MCNLYGVLSLASTGNDVLLRHCTCFRPFHELRGSLVKENQCVACLSYHSVRSFFMVDGEKSCFRSSERKVVSTHPLGADFTSFTRFQSLPRSSHGTLRKTNLCQAFLQQEVLHRFMVTHKTYWLYICWLYGTGIRFSANNLKRKARCGGRLLEYVQVNKIMQKLRKRKVRKHVKVLPRKVFQNRQACH